MRVPLRHQPSVLQFEHIFVHYRYVNIGPKLLWHQHKYSKGTLIFVLRTTPPKCPMLTKEVLYNHHQGITSIILESTRGDTHTTTKTTLHNERQEQRRRILRKDRITEWL